MLFGSGKGSVACIYVALSEAWIALYQSHINARCHLESRALWLVLWRSSVAGNSVRMSGPPGRVGSLSCRNSRETVPWGAE